MERTILVAEDSPTQAEHLRLLLEREGYRVDLVADGREGIERVQSAPPDLIISDVVMPEVNGYAFCQAVKSAARTQRIPFVLLTERNTPADFIKGLQHGADNFITKPFEDDYLLERVRRIFENLELRRLGHLDVEITLSVSGQRITVNADKQQMIELLFATLDELVRANGRLMEAQRSIEEYANDLEAKVRERTQQLLQAEKLVAMGELLAGVAHELNNPLSVVMGHTALLREATGSTPLGERAEKIGRAAERCGRIVKNFLALARQHPPERQRVALHQVVQEAVELLAYSLRTDNVEVTLNFAPDVPVLWADPHHLHQVVMNLVTNAHHAMRETPQPRRLTLSTRHDPSQRRVLLEVADTGCGIPPEIQARIFDPFFTTKPPGEGTGLGLSLCHGIIEDHGGSIRVKSQPDQGATFLIELPIEAIPTAKLKAADTDAPVAVRPMTILIADDEAEVAEVLTDMLSAGGHQVETVANGAQALEKLRERAYDLILCDLRMPELDGPGLYQELQQRQPELCRRFIFLTGDTLSPESREFLAQTGARSLSKPFEVEEVRWVVRQALRAE